MALLRVILMSSAMIASVQSFPSTTQNLEHDLNSDSQRKIKASDFQQPLAMLVKDKDSVQELPIVEFVYKVPAESSKAEKGTNREKYTINPISNENNEIFISNTTENLKLPADSKDDYNINTINVNRANIIATTPKQEESSFIETYIKQDEWLLNPKEVSPIIGPPKYLYEMLNPIPPFPEVYTESRQKEAILPRIEKPEHFPPSLTTQTKQSTHVAGPMLYPQSTYAREFDLPFFD